MIGQNPLISFITSFKKFKPPYDRIQHSAIYSWQANGINVYTALNEAGIKDNCSKYPNIIYTPDVKRGRELGFKTQAPIVKDMIEKALPLIETPMVALINSDIIIEPGFPEKFKTILNTYGFDIFLAGSRQGINLTYTINTPEAYKKVVAEPRMPYDPGTSSDIFIASKFLWKKITSVMPEFILGRYSWDNWLHQYAQINLNKRYNCTKALPLIHCEHSYEHILIQEGSKERSAPSSQYNMSLWKPFLDKYGTARVSYWQHI